MKESQQVEWKSAWRDDYLRWICGFANAEGGKLVIGRDDRGVAVGVKDAAYLESWGRGIDMIRQACQEHGCPEPLLRWDNGLWVEFRFAGTDQVTAQVTDQVTGEVTAQVTAQVTAEVERLVLEFDGRMSRAQVQQALGLLHRENFRKHYLVPALRAGILEMTLLDNPKSSRQQYRLTAKGELLKAKLLKEKVHE